MNLPFAPWIYLFAMVTGALVGDAAPSHESISGAGRITVQVDALGRYQVQGGRAGWLFAGQLRGGVVELAKQSGTDTLGAYQEIRFRLRKPGTFTGRIRAYQDDPVVQFGLTADEGTADGLPLLFPDFTTCPPHLHRFSYRESEFSPPSFAAEQNGTPWLLFDDEAHAVIVSPAANFLIARLSGDGRSQIASGLNPGVKLLPAGFSHGTLLTFGDGINRTWEAWGEALDRLVGRKRPANDADVGLRYLGYWTDNGADYYYKYDTAIGYVGTLEKLVARYRQERIPIRYLQLDSWWYSKTLTNPDGSVGKPKNPKLPEGEWNRYGGLLKYEAHPALFPHGLAAFQQEIGIPLITHNRWIDPASPYHQRYQISGLAAVDPQWWRDIMGYLSGSGVVGYEQDWLNVIYEHSPDLANRVGAGNAFTGGMAQAAAERGLSLQYCMALPRYFLQGARYDNLTTIRASGDRFSRDRWNWFLYTSRLAAAVGIWPWTDVFMSHETDNLLIATLSAGMVGTGDKLGSEDKVNLLKAVRADGVIVKPDAPLVPLDAVYVADAKGGEPPMIAATFTQHAAQRTAYVFVYARGNAPTTAAFTPADVGLTRECYIYDVAHRIARRVAANERFAIPLTPAGTGYFIIAPVSPAGIAFFGDEGKFVSNGRKRIVELKPGNDGMTAKIAFAAMETSVRVFGYSAAKPVLRAESGTVENVTYDSATGRFIATVHPGGEPGVELPGRDPVSYAVIAISAGR